jgi:hypothetical protein
MAYLYHHYEPDSNTELLRMQQRAKAYQMIGDELYKTKAYQSYSHDHFSVD